MSVTSTDRNGGLKDEKFVFVRLAPSTRKTPIAAEVGCAAMLSLKAAVTEEKKVVASSQVNTFLCDRHQVEVHPAFYRTPQNAMDRLHNSDSSCFVIHPNFARKETFCIVLMRKYGLKNSKIVKKDFKTSLLFVSDKGYHLGDKKYYKGLNDVINIALVNLGRKDAQPAERRDISSQQMRLKEYRQQVRLHSAFDDVPESVLEKRSRATHLLIYPSEKFQDTFVVTEGKFERSYFLTEGGYYAGSTLYKTLDEPINEAHHGHIESHPAFDADPDTITYRFLRMAPGNYALAKARQARAYFIHIAFPGGVKADRFEVDPLGYKRTDGRILGTLEELIKTAVAAVNTSLLPLVVVKRQSVV